MTILAAVLLALCGMTDHPSATAQAAAVTKKEAGNLVVEYCKDDTGNARRAEILTRLKTADRGLVGTPLKTAAADAAQVEYAVELGLALRVPGLFANAKKFIDGDFEDKIVEYGMALGEAGAADMVWERWKAKDIEGTSWGICNKAMLTHKLSMAVLIRVKQYLDAAKDDDPRLEPSAAILRFQLGLGDLNIESVKAEWKQIMADYEIDSKVFSLSGISLLTADAEIKGSVLQVGPNRRMRAIASLNIAATDAWQKNQFTVVARVRPGKGSEVCVSLKSKQGAWSPTFKAGEWVLGTGNAEQLVVPGKPGEWVEIRFNLSPSQTPKAGAAEVRGSRHCEILVGSTKILEYGTLNGDMEYFEVEVTDGTATVGGIELIAK